MVFLRRPEIDMPKQIIIPACVFFLAVCSGGYDEQKYKNYRELRHPDGFVVRIPPSLAAEQTPHGYVVHHPNYKDLRYPMFASMQRIAIDEAPELAERKKVGSRSVAYQIDNLGNGGSGGTEYRLRILLVSANGAFLYHQEDQSEYGEPPFDLCWDLVKTTELIKGK